MLGVSLDSKYVAQLETTLRLRAAKPRRQPAPKADLPEGYGTEWDDQFQVIAGYTEGGAAFGIPWPDDDAPAEPDGASTSRIRSSKPRSLA